MCKNRPLWTDKNRFFIFILAFWIKFLAFACEIVYYGIAYEIMLICKMDNHAKPYKKGEMT